MTAALALKGPLRAPGEVGRPSTYTEERGELCCQAIANGLPIRRFREREDLPDPMTLYRWARDYPTFRERFALARQALADNYAFRGLDVLEDVDPDSEYGSARVSQARDTAGHLRWLAGHLDPPTWGDKVQHDVQGVVAVVTLPLDLMLPAATAATNDGRNVHDPRVLELRALAAARRPVDGKQGA